MPIKGKIDVHGDALLECPLCDRLTQVKIDKTGNPYLVCNFCGVQMFVRYRDGQGRLDRILHTGQYVLGLRGKHEGDRE